MGIEGRTRRVAWGVLLLAGLLMTAGQATAQESTPPADGSFPVTIHFVNAVTSLGSIDVYINGDESEQRVLEGFEYGTVSDAFEGTAPATVIVIKQNVNWGVDRYLFNTIVPTEAGKTYVVTVSDFLIIPTEIDLSATGPDNARSRAVHAAAQAPAVDVFVTPAGETLSLGDHVPVITDLKYGGVTDGGPVPTGSYDVRLTATGTDTVALEEPSVTIDAGQVYTFVVIGKPGSTEQPLTLLQVALPAATS
jgi:hypothetical protein